MMGSMSVCIGIVLDDPLAVNPARQLGFGLNVGGGKLVSLFPEHALTIRTDKDDARVGLVESVVRTVGLIIFGIGLCGCDDESVARTAALQPAFVEVVFADMAKFDIVYTRIILGALVILYFTIKSILR